MEKKQQIDLEEIYLVLTDLRYDLHREIQSIAEYKELTKAYYPRVALAARKVGDMLPPDRLETLGEQ